MDQPETRSRLIDVNRLSEWLTVADLADYLTVSSAWAYCLVNKGKVVSISTPLGLLVDPDSASHYKDQRDHEQAGRTRLPRRPRKKGLVALALANAGATWSTDGVLDNQIAG